MRDKGVVMGNRVTHFEVGSRDHQALGRFYRELLGWRLRNMGEGYTLVDTQAGSGLTGGIGRSDDGTPWVSFYVKVDDVQAVLDRAESLGGKTVMAVTEFPGLRVAMFSDPDGNPIGLVSADSTMIGGPPSPGEGPAVDWFEVLGADADRTQRFYGELFGWTADESGFPSYRLVNTQAGEDAVGGGLGASQEGRIWATVYAKVADVETTLSRAEALGGGRVYGPNRVDDHMQTGAFRDPAGNVFGVYEHRH